MSFITITSFDAHTQATPVKSLLDSYDIYCHLKNEHAGNNPHILLPNMINRIELQVKAEDYDTAKNILIEYGYYKEPEAITNTLWQQIDKATANWPLVNDRPVVFRLLFIIVPLLLIIIGILVWYYQPDRFEQLTTRQWCVDAVEYNGEPIAIHTLDRIASNNNKCSNELAIYGYNELFLPGTNSSRIHGTWLPDRETNKLKITQTDTLQNIYIGEYDILIDGYELTLQSVNTVIRATDSRGIYYR